MKKILISLYTILALSATSCSDFLDSHPSYAVDTDVAVTDEVAEALTNACYTPLQSSNLYNMPDLVVGHHRRKLRSRRRWRRGRDRNRAVRQFRRGQRQRLCPLRWRSPWVGIGQCNIVINSLSRRPLTEIYNRSMGEAYFLRAHYYYILVRLSAVCPCAWSPTTPVNPRPLQGLRWPIARADHCRLQTGHLAPSGQEQLLVGRLQPRLEGCRPHDAGRHLPDLAARNPTMPTSSRSASRLRPWVIDLARCEFADNFGIAAEISPEAIFTVGSGNTQYDFWGSDNQASGSRPAGPPQLEPRGRQLHGLPTDEFMAQWEEGDLRKDVTVLYDGCPAFDGTGIRNRGPIRGYNVRKFLVSKEDSPEYNTSPSDFIVYRYADVLLMKAEGAQRARTHRPRGLHAAQHRPHPRRTPLDRQGPHAGGDARTDHPRTPHGVRSRGTAGSTWCASTTATTPSNSSSRSARASPANGCCSPSRRPRSTRTAP